MTDENLACDATFATWTNTPGSNESRPMNCANWYEAYAFCIWDGGFLPSETEWNYAAAGGAYWNDSSALVTSERGGTVPGSPRQFDLGFRCARAPELED